MRKIPNLVRAHAAELSRGSEEARRPDLDEDAVVRLARRVNDGVTDARIGGGASPIRFGPPYRADKRKRLLRSHFIQQLMGPMLILPSHNP